MSKRKVSKEAEVLALLAETPLSGLIESLNTGLYLPAPDDQPEEGETVIGELTDFEKALWSATVGLMQKAEAIADANNTMVDEATRHSTKVDALAVFLNKSEFEATITMRKALSEMLWSTLKKRLGQATYDGGGIGIRANYQVVSTPEVSENAELLAKLVMSGRGPGLALALALGGLSR